MAAPDGAYAEMLRRQEQLAGRVEQLELREAVMAGEAAAEEQQSSVSISRDGIKVGGKDVNLIFTVAGAIAAIVTVILLFQHGTESKEASAALVTALKEQTVALRENTCNSTYRGPENERADFCKRNAR